jgi:broad specificity phosphatase PhoE
MDRIMNFVARLGAALATLFFANTLPAVAEPASGPGLAGTTILLIRHAEKPPEGSGDRGLIPAGQARARAYASYFQNFALDGKVLHIDTLVATAASKNSDRPRLTVEPFSRASGLALQQPFEDKDVTGLANWLAGGAPHRTVLIAWHHGKIPALLQALGADPQALLPGGAWPPETFDWVIYLHYGQDGHLDASRRIVEPPGLAG